MTESPIKHNGRKKTVKEDFGKMESFRRKKKKVWHPFASRQEKSLEIRMERWGTKVETQWEGDPLPKKRRKKELGKSLNLNQQSEWYYVKVGCRFGGENVRGCDKETRKRKKNNGG